MSVRITEHRCPECGAALQLATSTDGSLRACRCGYGKDTPETFFPRVVRYIQRLGGATITDLRSR